MNYQLFVSDQLIIGIYSYAFFSYFASFNK